ncbi:MAG: hypothetical protein JWO78_1040 [Micavibrio sp.]|nr:hypothetical protein [Micavibrio sp.]
MVAAVLLEAGLPFMAKVLAESLGKVDSPLAQTASETLGRVSDAITGGSITPEQMAEANRHAEVMAGISAETDKAAYEQINESLRAEVASEDKYVRRMRPTFGYIIAASWGAQMMAVAYVIVFRTEEANMVINAMQSMGTLWTVGLSVLGIYVYKRSEDKKFLPPSSAPTVQNRTSPATSAADSLPLRQSNKYQFNE